MGIPPNKPPLCPWTVDQRILATNRSQADLRRAETPGRSADSVAEGVAKLKELLALPARRAMVVYFVWSRNGGGEMVVNSIIVNTRVVPCSADPIPATAQTILLSSRGLEYPKLDSPVEPHGRTHWEAVPEEDYPVIVRFFQLYEEDLDEIIRLLQMN